MILVATNMFIDSFIRHLKNERKYSLHTLRAYAKDLRAFEEFLQNVEESLSLITVDVDLLRLWVASLVDNGSAASSVCRKLSSLRSFYAYMCSEGNMNTNPALLVCAPKCPKSLPAFVKAEEMDELIDEISFGEGFLACRDRAIILCFYETGIRLSELVGLNLDSVDLEQKQLKVLGKRNRERIIPFADELRGELCFYIAERAKVAAADEQALFLSKNGMRVNQQQVYRVVNKRLAGATGVKKKSPHVLRHSFATAMLNNDAELMAVKELLGHKRLATTEIYTHLTFEELKRSYDKAHPRAGNN